VSAKVFLAWTGWLMVLAAKLWLAAIRWPGSAPSPTTRSSRPRHEPPRPAGGRLDRLLPCAGSLLRRKVPAAAGGAGPVIRRSASGRVEIAAAACSCCSIRPRGGAHIRTPRRRTSRSMSPPATATGGSPTTASTRRTASSRSGSSPPLLLGETRRSRRLPRGLENRRQGAAGRRVLLPPENNHRFMLRGARLTVAATGVLLGCWSGSGPDPLGPAGGLVSLALFALCPRSSPRRLRDLRHLLALTFLAATGTLWRMLRRLTIPACSASPSPPRRCS